MSTANVYSSEHSLIELLELWVDAVEPMFYFYPRIHSASAQKENNPTTTTTNRLRKPTEKSTRTHTESATGFPLPAAPKSRLIALIDQRGFARITSVAIYIYV